MRQFVTELSQCIYNQDKAHSGQRVLLFINQVHTETQIHHLLTPHLHILFWGVDGWVDGRDWLIIIMQVEREQARINVLLGVFSHITGSPVRARYTPIFNPGSQLTWNKVFLVSEEMGVREKEVGPTFGCSKFRENKTKQFYRCFQLRLPGGIEYKNHAAFLLNASFLQEEMWE